MKQKLKQMTTYAAINENANLLITNSEVVYKPQPTQLIPEDHTLPHPNYREQWIAVVSTLTKKEIVILIAQEQALLK